MNQKTFQETEMGTRLIGEVAFLAAGLKAGAQVAGKTIRVGKQVAQKGVHTVAAWGQKGKGYFSKWGLGGELMDPLVLSKNASDPMLRAMVLSEEAPVVQFFEPASIPKAQTLFDGVGSVSNTKVPNANQSMLYSPNYSPNAQDALYRKLRILVKAEKTAIKIETLLDGRIRYYWRENSSAKPGPTRGSAYVVEFNPKTGQVRSWQECRDHQGKVNRVHPKTLNGQELIAQHYPPIKSELENFSKKPGNQK